MGRRECFENWLNRCASIAMRFEWCIDPTGPKWRKDYEAGLTPQLAVENLFAEIREESTKVETVEKETGK